MYSLSFHSALSSPLQLHPSPLLFISPFQSFPSSPLWSHSHLLSLPRVSRNFLLSTVSSSLYILISSTLPSAEDLVSTLLYIWKSLLICADVICCLKCAANGQLFILSGSSHLFFEFLPSHHTWFIEVSFSRSLFWGTFCRKDQGRRRTQLQRWD